MAYEQSQQAIVNTSPRELDAPKVPAGVYNQLSPNPHDEGLVKVNAGQTTPKVENTLPAERPQVVNGDLVVTGKIKANNLQVGKVDAETLKNSIEGSDYISVDDNEAGTKLVVALDETLLETEEAHEDSTKLITSGAVFNGLANKVDINTTAPESPTSTGYAGEIRVGTDGYIYICTATDTWLRVQCSTWSFEGQQSR